MNEMQALCFQLRRDAVDIIKTGGGGHIGGDMSIMEILVSLYFHSMNITPETVDDPNRDLFVLSKGHCVEALYTVLAKKGFLSLEQVKSEFGTFGTAFIGHPNNKLPGIEMNSGALGHGLPVAVGMALAGKMDKRPYHVYVVMGDGELGEGSVWEGAMSASQYGLDNLTAIIDRNRLQISGSTEIVMHQEPCAERFAAFGWHVITAEGNNISAMNAALDEAAAVKGKPVLIIAETTKGFGSSIMENKASWHHHTPNDEEYQQIIHDLREREEMCLHE